MADKLYLTRGFHIWYFKGNLYLATAVITDYFWLCLIKGAIQLYLMKDAVQLSSPVDTLYILFCSMPMRRQNLFVVSFPKLFRKLWENSEVISQESMFISFRDRCQILLLILNDFNWITYFLFPLKLLKNHNFCNHFREKRS